jgi:Ca2+-binding EF-hand superfamily protein
MHNFEPKETKYDVDLKSLAEKLPVDRTEESKNTRREMFRTIDQNGSGQISLAELDLGIKTFLGEECFLLKPAIKEAFKAAKDQGKFFKVF